MKKRTNPKSIPYKVMTATGLAVMLTTSILSPALPIYQTVAYAEEVNPVLGSTTVTPFRYSQGSSYWTTSNIREWLNNDQFEVQYTNQAPTFEKLNSRSYDREPGFLTSFSVEEQNAIAVTERRSFVSGNDGAIAREGGTAYMYRSDGYGFTIGPFAHFASPNIQNAWKSVFYQTVNDKVFMLSPNEMFEYVQKRGISYKKSLTDEAKTRFNISSEYYPWFSTHARSDIWEERVFSVDASGNVFYGGVNSSYGIAPALHVKPDYVFNNGKKARDVEIGESIVFGSYNGQPIQWTVINKTPEGYPLLWATKLITIKVFDTQGDDTLKNSITVNYTTPDVSIKEDLKFSNGKTDTTNPVIKVVNATDLNTAKNGNWTLIVEATDASGIEKIILPNGSSVAGNRVEYEIEQNGSYFFTAVDKVGNHYGTSIPVGNISPPASVQIKTSANGWTNNDVKVDIFATNADAGVEKAQYIQNSTSAFGSGYWSEYSSYAGKRIKATGTVRLVEAKVDVGSYATGLRIMHNYRQQTGDDYHIGRTYPIVASVPLKDLMDGSSKTLEVIYTVPGNYFGKLSTDTAISSPPQLNGNYIVEWTNVKFELLDKEDFGIQKIILPNGSEVLSNSYTDTITQEGTYTYKVLDSRGMITEKTVEVKIDKTAPALTITGNPTQKTNKDAILKVQATDTQSGIKRIQKPNGEWYNGSFLDYTVYQNGTYNFLVEDNAGNTKTQSVTVSNIDKTPPTIPQFTPSITNSTNQNVTVTINYSADSVTKEYRVNGGTWTPYSAPIIMTANGTVEARATDDIGNISHVSRYDVNNIDRISPENPIFIADKTAPSNSDVKVSIQYPSDSTVKQYRVNGGTWQAYTSQVVMTSNGLIEARGYDDAGNVSEITSYSVTNIDKTMPYAGTPYSVSGSFVNETTYKVRVSGVGDQHSGVSKVAFPTWTDLNGQDDLIQPWSEKEIGTDLGNGVWEYTIDTSKHNNEDGVYRTHVYVYDKAGNSVMVGQVLVTVDRVAPIEATFIADQTKATNQDVLVSISYPSDASVKEFRINGGAWTAYSSPIKMSANGKIESRSFDQANNQSVITAYQVTNIDKVNPAIPVLSASVTTPTNEVVDVAISYPSDSFLTQYRLNNGLWQDYTGSITFASNGMVEARAIDEAGNISSVAKLTVSNIDKTAPTMPVISPSITVPTNQNVLLSVSYSTDSSVKEFRVNGGAWTTYTTPITITESGSIDARAVDEAGNISEVSSYQVNNIDKVAPVKPTIISDKTTPTNQDVLVTVSYPLDAKRKQVRVNNGTWVDYASPIAFSENGFIEARAYDDAGNVSPVTSYSVTNIDKVSPESPSYVATENKNLIKATKEIDAILLYRVNDGIWTVYSEEITLNDGKYNVEFKAIDEAGNQSEAITGQFVMYRDALTLAESKVSFAESNPTQENVDLAKSKVELIPHTAPEYEGLIKRLIDLQALLDAKRAIETAIASRNEADVQLAQQKISLLNNSNPVILDLMDEIQAGYDEADILALVAKERYDILSSRYQMTKESYTALVNIYYAIKYTGDFMYKYAEEKVALVPSSDKHYDFVNVQYDKLKADYGQFVQERIQTDAEIKAESSVKTMETKYDPSMAVNTQNLINSVEDPTVRASLQTRLDNAKAKYEASLLAKVDQEAIFAVEKAEQYRSSYYVSEAYKKVNYLTNAELKFELTNRLQQLEADMALQKQVSDATKSVQLAEQYPSTTTYLTTAQTKVNALPDVLVKAELQARIDKLKAGLDQTKVVKDANSAVSLAQSMKTQYYVDKARVAISLVLDETIRFDLTNKVNAIVVK